MKNKIIYKYLGKVLIVYSFMMIIPIIIGIYFKNSIIGFIIPLIISLIVGIVLNRIKTINKNIYAKDGFIIVSLSWIIISLIGAIPFCIDRNISYVDALFETVSAITTTGSTIFNNVEVLPNSLLFYRSYLQLIGGMGVITFVMAIIPLSRNDKSLHLIDFRTGKYIKSLFDFNDRITTIKKFYIEDYGEYFFVHSEDGEINIFGNPLKKNNY